MIGTTGSQVGQFRSPIRIHKLENFLQTVIVSNQALLAGDQPSNHRKNAAGKFFAIGTRRITLAPKNGTGFALDLTKHELADLIDDPNCIEIACALCVAPGEESVSTQYDAIATGMRLHGILHHEAQLKSRTLPRNPHDFVIESEIEFLKAFETVRGRCQRDAPVGMKMVYVTKRKKGVQRRVDGSCHVVLAERTQRIKVHHLVLVGNTSIAALEANDLVEEKSSKAAALDASKVAAAPLNPQNFRGSATDRICLHNLGAGVSAAEICYAQVGAQKIRAIAKQFRLVKCSGQLRIP